MTAKTQNCISFWLFILVAALVGSFSIAECGLGSWGIALVLSFYFLIPAIALRTYYFLKFAQSDEYKDGAIKKCAFWLHHRLGPIGTILVTLPVLYFVWMVAHDPFMSIASGWLPSYVLSGKLFSERFNIIHAGFTLDQPTIGKWLFWFTIMAGVSLPYLAILRLVSNRTRRLGYWTYAMVLLVFCVLLFCILSRPVCWLIQYVHSMGLTGRRLFGLTYSAGAFIGIVFFAIWALRSRRRDDFEESSFRSVRADRVFDSARISLRF